MWVLIRCFIPLTLCCNERGNQERVSWEETKEIIAKNAIMITERMRALARERKVDVQIEIRCYYVAGRRLLRYNTDSRFLTSYEINLDFQIGEGMEVGR